jgi:hypothetical protein
MSIANIDPNKQLTRRSSRLPKAGAEVLGFESVFFGSDCLEGAGSLFGSGFFPCEGEGVLDSSFGFGSSFVDGSGSEDVDWSLEAGSLGSEAAFSFSPPEGAPPSLLVGKKLFDGPRFRCIDCYINLGKVSRPARCNVEDAGAPCPSQLLQSLHPVPRNPQSASTIASGSLLRLTQPSPVP